MGASPFVSYCPSVKRVRAAATLGALLVVLSAGAVSGGSALANAIPNTLELKFRPGLGDPVVGTTFTAVSAYWDGSIAGYDDPLTNIDPSNCTASVHRWTNGRFLYRLGAGQLTTTGRLVANSEPPRQGLAWSWQIPNVISGKATAGNILIVRCHRLLLLAPPPPPNNGPVPYQLRKDFVRWYSILKTAP